MKTTEMAQLCGLWHYVARDSACCWLCK